MNPYDFVPIDWSNPPERHRPSPHDRFDGISGKIEGTITAETPLFIRSPQTSQGAQPFIKNKQNQHIVPGSSLKGLFRNLVETIGNGCFVFDKLYCENNLPNEFKKCNAARLCIACRMFGRIPDQGDTSSLHLGNVSFNDAIKVKIWDHDAVHLIALMSPKPHHQAFYLGLDGNIAGRKFYFHQPSGIQKVDQEGELNPYIKPVDKGSQFTFSVQFTNLEAIELQTLLYAFVLEPGMRHKLGYGKPAGLGSVHFEIEKLTLIDYASRYSTTSQGRTEYDAGNGLATYLRQQTNNTASRTLNALRRIWRWDPNDKTSYHYPNQDWFGDNPTTPISGTP